MLSRALLVLLAGLMAAPASGQGADSTRAPAPFLYGRAITYGEMLRERRMLRLPVGTDADSTDAVDPFLGIQGLVVDETATPPGRLFYEAFFLLWTPPPGAERVALTLGEQPLPGTGTAIVVRADGEIILQTRLPRRTDEVEALAAQAVQFVRRRIATG
ncbi:MAG: CsgE family curli-type amyloid fiber assembly protein [Bacteroidota bacterium]